LLLFEGLARAHLCGLPLPRLLYAMFLFQHIGFMPRLLDVPFLLSL
jgi:hypothetical protein